MEKDNTQIENYTVEEYNFSELDFIIINMKPHPLILRMDYPCPLGEKMNLNMQ